MIQLYKFSSLLDDMFATLPAVTGSTMDTMTRRDPDFLMVGTDTFRGTMGSTLLRTQLYAKNEGEHRVFRDGLQKTDSSISGNLLVSAKSMNQNVSNSTFLSRAPLAEQLG